MRTITRAAIAAIITLAALAATDTAHAESVTIARIVDGDTVVLSTGERVRLVGIDTPERDKAGYAEARDALAALVGQPANVTYDGGTDKYGRRLLSLTAAGSDIGWTQLAAGRAVPRYDSTDGYGTHPNETLYHDGLAATAPATPAPATPQQWRDEVVATLPAETPTVEGPLNEVVPPWDGASSGACGPDGVCVIWEAPPLDPEVAAREAAEWARVLNTSE